MKKIKQNPTLTILVFLGLFGLAIGTFDNYRELWLSSNGISTLSISHVISISYVVTVLVLFYFTIKVSSNILKQGICYSLVIKLVINTLLICLNNQNQLFLIKFLMFFDASFSQLILSSIYPLMMHIKKDDILYAKKSAVESISAKVGFLLVSILIGKNILNFVVNYNTCLLISVIFTFLSFIIFLFVDIDIKKDNSNLDIKGAFVYFKQNKVLCLYLFQNILGNTIWSCILGMPMLLLINNLGFSSKISSFLILGLGIISNILSIIIVKFLKFKNDYINAFFKWGLRVILYLIIFITENNFIFLITILYLLITDCTHNFIFTSYFINKVDEKYSFVMTILKYCTTLIGNAVGVFLCGLEFNLKLRLFILPTLILAIIHYIVIFILIKKKKEI